MTVLIFARKSAYLYFYGSFCWITESGSVLHSKQTLIIGTHSVVTAAYQS